MKNMGTYELTSDDKKELTSMLPNFQLKTLNKWMKNKVSAQRYENEILFYPFTYYGSFSQSGYPELSFQATQKHKEWLNTDNIIFMKPCKRKIPKPLTDFIKETFFTELNKNIPSYGIISLHYDYNKKTLINWKNKLGFNINKNIKKEFITLQLKHRKKLKQKIKK